MVTAHSEKSFLQQCISRNPRNFEHLKGGHLFSEGSGGSYRGRGGAMANRSSFARGGGAVRLNARSGSAGVSHSSATVSHAGAARSNAAQHSSPARAGSSLAAPAGRASASRASASHSGGSGHVGGGGHR